MDNKSNLVVDAAFKIEVFHGVYWVLANILGRAQYSSDDICRFIHLWPEEKADKTHTLYDSIQLFQASRFYGHIDNVRIVEEETTIMSTFHKPGYHAVRTNGGCCAANSNWLHYILRGKYQEIGCFGFNLMNGEGNIINYIKYNNEFYFIDMMMQRFDSLQYTGTENGDISDYQQHDFTGFIHKSTSLKDYVLFLQNKHPHNPVLFYIVRGECHGVLRQLG